MLRPRGLHAGRPQVAARKRQGRVPAAGGLGRAGIYRIICACGRQPGLTIHLRALRPTTFAELKLLVDRRLDVAGHGPPLRLAGGQPCGGCQEVQPTEQRITELYDRSTERPSWILWQELR